MLGASVLTAGNWFYVVGVYDSAAQKAKVYVNGNLDGEYTKSGSIDNPAANPVRIGTRSPGTTLPFNGLIGEVRIYSRVLTPQEILDHYIIGKEMFG